MKDVIKKQTHRLTLNVDRLRHPLLWQTSLSTGGLKHHLPPLEYCVTKATDFGLFYYRV